MLRVQESQGLTRQDFAARLGISAGVLSHISSGRNNPGLDLITSLLQTFREVNPEWLLFGNGDMLRSAEPRNERIELIKAILELKLMNEMNYNALRDKIESLELRLKQGSEQA